jgi:Ca2+-binding EF-hand superfamily protein
MPQPTDPTLDELQEIFDRIDKNGDGRVSFPEFKSLMLEMGDPRRAAALRSSFSRIDADHNGRIDIEELRTWLCRP